jgi:hypothetical protein
MEFNLLLHVLLIAVSEDILNILVRSMNMWYLTLATRLGGWLTISWSDEGWNHMTESMFLKSIVLQSHPPRCVVRVIWNSL